MADRKNESAAKRLKELDALLSKHNDLYYNQDNPIIDDAVYDALKKEREELIETHPEIAAKSDLSSVGHTPSGPFERIAHQ